MTSLLGLDGSILLYIQETIRNPLLTSFFKFITWLGDGGKIWIGTAVILLFFRKTRKAGIMVLISLLFSHLFNNILLKNLAARVRPYEVVAGLETLIKRPSSYSFPSGHSASSFAAAWVMLRKFPRRYGIPAVVLACLIGFSRLYLGVHYPTDVICGILGGVLVSYVAVAFFEWITRLRESRKAAE